jgi:hypothetical protein
MTEQEIFTAAIRLTGDARMAFVRQACGSDEKLRPGGAACFATRYLRTRTGYGGFWY